MNSKIAIQNQLKNNNEVFPTSYYKQIKLSAQSNSAPVLSSATQQTTFEIPSGNNINFSRMSLSFKRGALSANPAANYYQLLYTIFFAYFQRLELYTSSNIRLCDVNYVDAYNKVASPCMLDYKKRNKIDGFLYPPTIRNSKIGVTMALAAANDNTKSNFSPFTPNATWDGATIPNNVLNIDEPEYIVSSSAATLLAWENITFNILLKDILPDTIFNMDQDIYFNKVLYLRITWNNVNSLGVASLTALGAAAGSLLWSNNGGNITIPITNLNLNVYTQANPIINQLTQQKFSQQQEIIIPDIQCNSIGLTGTYQNTWVKVIWNSLKASLYKTYNLIAIWDLVTNLLNSNNYNSVKWTSGKLYVNSDLILDLNNQFSDTYKHVTTQHKNHWFMSYQFFDDVSPFVNLFDSESINDKSPYDGSLKGKWFDNSGNEILINHQFNTPNAGTTTYTHYIFAVV